MEAEGRDSSSKLFGDVLAEVLGQIPRVELKLAASRVSRAWRSAAALPLAWRCTDIDNRRLAQAAEATSAGAIALIKKHGGGMRSLSISDTRPGPPLKRRNRSVITDALVAAITEHCPALRCLELRACKLELAGTATAIVALVERLAAGGPGGRMDVFGCNLLRGEDLARCGELVERMTSGECNEPDCHSGAANFRWLRFADFFEDPMTLRFGEQGGVLTLQRCPMCVSFGGGSSEVYCQDCSDGHMITCDGCEEVRCFGCAQICYVCDKTLCEKCQDKDDIRYETCSGCYQTHCAKCQDEGDVRYDTCSDCYETLCEKCQDKGDVRYDTCSECYETLCEKCQDKGLKGVVRYDTCRECYETLCWKCQDKGDVRYDTCSECYETHCVKCQDKGVVGYDTCRECYETLCWKCQDKGDVRYDTCSECYETLCEKCQDKGDVGYDTCSECYETHCVKCQDKGVVRYDTCRECYETLCGKCQDKGDVGYDTCRECCETLCGKCQDKGDVRYKACEGGCRTLCDKCQAKGKGEVPV